MKKIILFTITLLFISPAIFTQSKAGKTDTSKHTSLYTCAKHLEVTGQKSGKCPICGMDLNISGKEIMKAEVTKNYSCPFHFDIATHDQEKCPQCGSKLNLSPKEQMKAEIMKLYTCDMHPEVALDKDGKCPKCGIARLESKQLK